MHFDDIRNCRVLPLEGRILLGEREFALDDSLPLNAPFGVVPVQALADAVKPYHAQSAGECQPQAAMLIYQLSGQLEALKHYFPILRNLDERQQIEFHAQLQRLLGNHNLHIVMKGYADTKPKTPEGVRVMIAGHILELFFFRQDILKRFLKGRRSFWVYPNKQSFLETGGTGGGDYHPVLRCVRLYMQRYFEGFYNTMPQQAPFLHEFGHMLEHFDGGKRLLLHGTGLLPGMIKTDRHLYYSEAHQLFLEGKHLEKKRYQAWQNQPKQTACPQPIGSPYVFKNDAEFIAGYLEMFFRNPHYFASQNISLYHAFERVFGWDPRQVWEQDFDVYVHSNKMAYSRGMQLNSSGLS